jgi:DnaJ-class molecular chaperone
MCFNLKNKKKYIKCPLCEGRGILGKWICPRCHGWKKVLKSEDESKTCGTCGCILED